MARTRNSKKNKKLAASTSGTAKNKKDNVNNKPNVNPKVTINHIDRLPNEVLALVVDLIPLSDRIHNLRLVSHRWKEVTELACRSSVHRLVLIGPKAMRDKETPMNSHGKWASNHLESYGFEDTEHSMNSMNKEYGRLSLYQTEYAPYSLKLSSNRALQRRTSCAQLLRLFPSIENLSLLTICLVEQFDECCFLVRSWGQHLTSLTLMSHLSVRFLYKDEGALKRAPPTRVIHPLFRLISTLVTDSVLPRLHTLTVASPLQECPTMAVVRHHLEHRSTSTVRPPKHLRAVNLIDDDCRLYELLLMMMQPREPNVNENENANSHFAAAPKGDRNLFRNLTQLSIPSLEATEERVLQHVIHQLAKQVFHQLTELSCYLNHQMVELEEEKSPTLDRLVDMINVHCTPGRLASLRLSEVHAPLAMLTQCMPRVAPSLRRLRLDYGLGYSPWIGGHDYWDEENDHAAAAAAAQQQHAANGLRYRVIFLPSEAQVLRLVTKQAQRVGGVVAFPLLELLHLSLWHGRYGQRPSQETVAHLRNRVFPALRTEVVDYQDSQALVRDYLVRAHSSSSSSGDSNGIIDLDSILTGTVRYVWRVQQELESEDEDGNNNIKDKDKPVVVSVTREADSYHPGKCHVRLCVHSSGQRRQLALEGEAETSSTILII